MRKKIVESHGIQALVAVLEHHRDSKQLVRMTCDIIYHMAKHDGTLSKATHASLAAGPRVHVPLNLQL